MIPEDLTALTAPALRKLVAEHNIKGRSTMTKPALIAALSALRVEIEENGPTKLRVTSTVGSEKAVQQAARDDEAVTIDALRTVMTGIERDNSLGTIDALTFPASGVDSFDMERLNSLPDGSMVVTFPKPSNLTTMSVGNADHLGNVASYLDRMNDTIDSFHMRAVERYLKDGRKRLTARQARRVGKKVNALMGRMGINA